MKKVPVPRKIIFCINSQSGFETSISYLSLSNVTFATNLESNFITHFLLPLPIRTIEQYICIPIFFIQLKNLKRWNYAGMRHIPTKNIPISPNIFAHNAVFRIRIHFLRIRIQASLALNIFLETQALQEHKMLHFFELGRHFAVFIRIRAPKKFNWTSIHACPDPKHWKVQFRFQKVLFISLYLSPSVQ